jgi:hypothetical protein
LKEGKFFIFRDKLLKIKNGKIPKKEKFSILVIFLIITKLNLYLNKKYSLNFFLKAFLLKFI